jgi:bifunctional DNase/RNase
LFREIMLKHCDSEFIFAPAFSDRTFSNRRYLSFIASAFSSGRHRFRARLRPEFSRKKHRMKRIELDIVALSHSVTQSHNYAVVLGERRGQRRLPIVIGSFEAQAIAVAMERMVPNRPLTHDLFKNTLDTFNIQLREVVINNLLDGIFYARLVCVKNGEVYEIDSRTSDAIAMAVRFDCPIYTYEFILEAAGVVLEEQEEESGAASPATGSEAKRMPSPKIESEALETLSVDALQRKLTEVLESEDYEMAARIRDELKRREQKG